jgi:plastocyanin
VLTVPVGTQVKSTQGAFGSAGLEHHATFSRTFSRPRRYDYFCALHPHMKGTVVVR